MKNISSTTIRYLILLFIISGLIVIWYKSSYNSDSAGRRLENSSCIHCHTKMDGFAQAHSPEQISCISCHLGNNEIFTTEAHENMVNIPGDLSNASETCAKCHEGIDIRVNNSIMNTMSGIISIDKHLFDENDNLDSLFNIHHLGNLTAAESHLRNKCASCHIGSKKTHPHPIDQLSRGGGCTACHLNYNSDAKKDLEIYQSSNKEILPHSHPSLSLQITDDHCFGCHSRSGRISTNYEGWHESNITSYDSLDSERYRLLDDGRIFVKKEADIHHVAGLSCIDCHDSQDVMGDGLLYSHKEEAVHTNCTDCHNDKQEYVGYEQLTTSNQRIIRLRHMNSKDSFAFSTKNSKAIINVIKRENNSVLITKAESKLLDISHPSSICTKPVHKDIRCSTCHTQWTPQCITCHTSYDIGIEGYDLLDKKWTLGKWIEHGDLYLAEYPSLGVMETNGQKIIETFTPGMIMTLGKESKDPQDFHRLFAPTSAHTISKKGRSCADCHLNPVALGYGRGELLLQKDGHWLFEPQYEIMKDGLPKDAWIKFLDEPKNAKATRSNARPFTLEEQTKILNVGACISCHKEDTKVQMIILEDFRDAKMKISNQCIIRKY